VEKHFGALSGVIPAKRVRAANMAQRRTEKRPRETLFRQTKGEPCLKQGFDLRVFSKLFAVRSKHREFP
jgi:hypothetical protein